MTDWQLLQQFTESNSQAAFAELCHRYTNLVYRVCERELGASQAEDAAQAVFLLLARKAPSLKPGRAETTLSSWLFQAALLTAKNARRQEQRRQARELEAAQMQAEEPPAWAEVAPLLNDALLALPPSQRSLLLERYFQDRPLAEIGAALGISEDAARMRVNRALDRLRRWFAARNIALSAAALAAVLPLAVRPAPTHAAEAIAHLMLPTLGDNTPPQTLAQGVFDTMNLKRLKLQLGAAALVAVFLLGTAGAVRVTTQIKARRVAAAQQENQAQAFAILNQMYATYAAMHSFKCHVTSRQEKLGMTTNAEYEIQYPKKIRFKRLTSFSFDKPTLVFGDKTSSDMTGESLAVSDGNDLYIASTVNHGAADRYTKMSLYDADISVSFGDWGSLPNYGGEAYAGMPGAAVGMRLRPPVIFDAPIYSMDNPVIIKFPGAVHPTVLDVVIARMSYRPGTRGSEIKGAAETVRYFIGKQDHLLYQVIAIDFLSPTDSSTMVETVSDIEVNPKLPASDFVFTPAPGSHEVPDTSDLFPGSTGH